MMQLINDRFWENESLQKVPLNFERTQKFYPDDETPGTPFTLDPQTDVLVSLIDHLTSPLLEVQN